MLCQLNCLLTIFCLHAVYCSKGLRVHPRIAQGNLAAIEQHPYAVSLHIEEGDHGSTCTGSLIAANWVLTAAHCVSDATSVSIRAGSADKHGGGEVRNSLRLIPHSLYSSTTHRNDIALIEVEPFTLSDNIQTINLPKKEEVAPPGSYVVIGWGRNEKNETQSMLHSSTIDLVDYNECNKNYYKNALTKRMLCAGGNGKGPCVGDSGGPLVKDDKLIGVTFFGGQGECGKEPSIFVYVSKIRNWIRDNTNL